MKIQRLEVERYKVYQDANHIELRPLTILVGGNSSGKSALSRAIPLLAGGFLVDRPDAAPLPLESYGLRYGDSLEASVKRSAWAGGPHSRKIRVTLAPAVADELNPEQAARFAEEELVVLVENRFSDGAFLSRVVEELDQTLKKWWRQLPAPVRIDSIGGKGQMEVEVKRRGEQSPRPRFVVVIDSDRRGPGDNPSREAHTVEKLCDSGNYDFPCWLLAKRESENYLPEELLEQRPNVGADHSRRLEAWNRLNDDQKDFYDMKDGLSDNPTDSERELFKQLSERDRAALSNGFGDKISECWEQYRGGGRVAAALRQRGRRDLERGLQLIRKEV
jgi:hypothetical protein